MTTPQQFANQLLGEFKKQVLTALNETADEFDLKDMSEAQRQTYNEFTGVFGNKVIQMQITLEEGK